MSDSYKDFISNSNDTLRDAILNPLSYEENFDLVAAFELKSRMYHFDDKMIAELSKKANDAGIVNWETYIKLFAKKSNLYKNYNRVIQSEIENLSNNSNINLGSPSQDIPLQVTPTGLGPEEKKYPALRTSAEILIAFGWLTILFTIVAAIFIWQKIDVWYALLIVAGGIIYGIFQIAGGELIKLFIDIEKNTRKK